MNLKEWRQEQSISMSEAARLLDVGFAASYNRYETGENRPDAPMVERILRVTEGKVGLTDLHRQRLDWLRENRPQKLAPQIELQEAAR